MFGLRRILGIILVLAIIAAGTFVVLDVLNSEAANGKPADPSEQNKDDPTEEPVIVKPKKPEILDHTVGLYTGRGSWDVDLVALRNFLADHNIEYVEIDQETISSCDLNQLCDILILVGGFSAEYLNHIENHANIRTFVESGGCFVGFCAGAYYACSTMRWEGNAYDYPLELFTGEGAGPYLPWGSLATINLNPEISFHSDFPDAVEMWYFGGPCFTGYDKSNVDILARYNANDEAAVIAFNYGRGRVLLLGPHPELGYIPSKEQVQTDGSGGALWTWLYAALQWLVSEKPV